MEEQDKLDDFFQNRLQQNGGNDDDWDRPSSRVWDGAHGQFPTHPTPRRLSAFWVLGIGLALLFAGMGTYAYTLKQEVQQLEVQLAQQPIATTQAPIIDQTQVSLIASLQTKNEQLTTELNTIRQSNTSLNTQVNHLKNQLSNRSNHPTTLTTLNTYHPSPILNNQLIIKPLINLNLPLKKSTKSQYTSLPTLTPPTESLSSLHPTQLDAVVPVISKKQKRRAKERKWEIGETLGTYSKIIPVETNFDKETFFEENPQVIIAQGFTSSSKVGYKLKDNLYLRSGLKLSIFAYKVPTTVNWVYDKSSEFIDSNGNTVNQFAVSTNSGFDNAESQFNIAIPDDMPLDDGDIVEAELFNIQTQRTFQIPIGLNYFIGQKRLKAMVSGGLSFNFVELGDHQISASFVHEEQELEVEEFELLDQVFFNTKHIGGHFGFGLDYQLGRRLHFRSNLVFEGNVFGINNLNTVSGKRRNTMEGQLEFGLFYRL